jgi:hypothetical protein
MTQAIARCTFLAAGLALAVPLQAATAIIIPAADTFLSEFSADHNTGAHIDVAAGTVSNGTRTRALLRFDAAAHIPAGAVITSASLRLEVTRTIGGGGVNSNFQLRRVLVPWTEGGQTGNLGARAAPGETTWAWRMAPDVPWNAPGGVIGSDYADAVSSATPVQGPGSYEFASTPEMVQDVQSWIDDPALNFGWLLMSDLEEVSETSRRFAAREDPNERAPVLTVEYIPPAPEFRILSLTVNGDEATLVWTNGLPTFQVQMRSSLSSDWTNIGSPTDASNAIFPLDGTQAFIRVVQDYTAEYQVEFDATWSQETHPADFPITSAHWSGLVGGVHNGQVHFWRTGELASEGIRLMAELGSQPRLLSEVRTAITNGTADFTLSGGGINPAPGSRLLVFPQPMRRDYPLVTLCSMIAPSPDWFVGVDSLSLLQNGAWVPVLTVTLFGHDAGTDSGPTYASPNAVTTPPEVITQFTDFPALVNGVIEPFGTLTFTRLD